MRKPWIYVALFLALFITESKASGLNIAATVGGQVISSYDVDKRVKFILFTTRLSNTPDTVARIRPQVIRMLIDERLQLQEAERRGITISDTDIASAIASLEKERNMPAGTVLKQLESASVAKETFLEQSRAQLAWNKLLVKEVRPHVRISNQDIELAKRKVSIPTIWQELRIGVLALPVDKTSVEMNMRSLAEKLVREVRTGADFEEVARQFGNRANGGKVAVFWVRPNQLDPAIAKALSTVQIGGVTDPVRTDIGFTIVKIYDAKAVEEDPNRDTQVSLKEILLSLKPDASTKEADMLITIAEEVAKNPGECGQKTVANIANPETVDMAVSLNTRHLSQLPAAVRVIVGNLGVGEISAPFASAEGIRLFMLCDKKEGISIEPDRDQLTNFVFQQKMDLEAQKYIRNLRRDTFIEIR